MKIKHAYRSNWLLSTDEDEVDVIYRLCGDVFEDEVDGGRIGVDENELPVHEVLLIRERILSANEQNSITRRMLQVLNPFYLEEMFKTGQIRNFVVKYVRNHLEELAINAWKDRYYGYERFGCLETEFYMSDLSERDKEEIEQLELSLDQKLTEAEQVYYFDTLIERMNEIYFKIDPIKRVVAYGCIRCGELFSVSFLYGNQPKFSPCCGDSVLTESTVEDIAVMLNSDHHDEHTKLKLRTLITESR